MLGFTNKGQSNVDLIVTSIDGSFRYEGLRGHSRLSSSVFVYRVLIFVLQCLNICIQILISQVSSGFQLHHSECKFAYLVDNLQALFPMIKIRLLMSVCHCLL